MQRTRLRIGVMGPGSCSREDAQRAEQVGRLLAAKQTILICGGGGGVMEAVSRGASMAGGVVVGILPSADEATANPYVGIPIVTGIGNARNAINVLTSHSVIAISGGPGTLSEIALALKVGTPVVGLNTWRFSIGDEQPSGLGFHLAKDPADAVEKAIDLAHKRVRRPS